jgi:hypothetical protein
VDVAIASCRELPDELREDELLIEALSELGIAAEAVPWNAGASWDSYKLVVIRSTWDYTQRPDDFLAWVDSVGPALHNPAAVVRWNSDKHYLADLEQAGLPVVPTNYLGPGDELPRFDVEFVLKPVVSAGARMSGRFWPDQRGAAGRLLDDIHGAGTVAMAQPYVADVDEGGEYAAVFCGGRFSHGLHKKAILRPGEVAPTRDDAIGSAEVMYDPGLVRPADLPSGVLDLAARLMAWLGERFGGPPLYARVDIAPNAGNAVLMEVELIEPCLYLNDVPEAAGRLAAAIAERLGSPLA